MIRRSYEPKLAPVRVSLTVEKPPVVDVMTWYEEVDLRFKFLREKFAHLLTPKRREVLPEGYVPAPYNSEGVRIKGVKQDSHRAGVTVR